MSTVTEREKVPTLFELPRKFYGRSAELKTLRAAFSDASQGRQVTVFLSGHAGMGKTALVYESVRSFPWMNGYFIAGKSDQLRQNIPYAPIASALSNLIRQWMTEKQEDLNRWRKRITRALSRNGKVVAELVPELKWIVGEQPDMDTLPPSEAQNRFRLVLRNFLGAIAGNGHPLVLFLDDLQWADPATITLLQYLIRDAELPYLLFIGAYREAEAKENQALMQLLEPHGPAGKPDWNIALPPLSEEQAIEWTAEALRMDPKCAVPFALALHHKSGGNPFFFRQLMISLHDDRLVYNDAGSGAWHWDQAAIKRLHSGADVLAFLVERLKKLPEKTLYLMKLASCMGNGFPLEMLAWITGDTWEAIISNIKPAILEGLVTQSEQAPVPASPLKEIPYVFAFLHDRVQQAVYSLIPEETKKEWHLLIGRLLMQHVMAGMLEDKILPIMDQINRSLDLITSPAERMELAGFNLIAGRKAKSSAAYASALEYFRSGMSLLIPSSWESAYPLTYDLYLELAQAEYMSANTEYAQALFDAVLSRAKTELQRAEAYALKVMLCAGMGKYGEAVETGIRALDRLGVRLPVPPRGHNYMQELFKCAWRIISKRNIPVQSDLPAAAVQPSAAVKKKAAELLARLASIISIYEPRAYTFTILKTSNYTIRYGNDDMAAIGYMGYGIVAGSLFSRYGEGHDLALKGLKLAERNGKSYAKCYVHFVMGALISHWIRPAGNDLDYLNKAVEYGVEAGDLLLSGYAFRFMLETGYLCGRPLHELTETLNNVQAFARRSNHQYLALNTALYNHIITFLQEDASKGFCYDAGEFEEEFLSAMKNDNASQAAYHILKMQLCYLSGDYESAFTMAKQIKGRMEAVTGFFITAEYVFYEALTIAALYDKLPRREKWRYLNTLKNDRRRMNKWSSGCKQNFLHKDLLIQAETARLYGRREQAMSLYDQAIQCAHDHGFRQGEALACELAAKFYISQKRKKIAGVYMKDAFTAYREWGAYAKANDIKRLYGELLPIEAPEEANSPAPVTETSLPNDAVSGGPDVQAADALHQAILMISRQEDPEGILEGFLRFAINSAHADKGILMLEKEGKLWIEDVIANGVRTSRTGTPVSMETGEGFSKPIVRYVFRTMEKAVWRLGDVTSAFFTDNYALREGVKTIACLPILFRGIPAGVLYLENNRDEGAFTDERMQKLELESGQLVTVKKLLHYLEGEQGAQPVRLAETLTLRETDVLRLIAAGLTNKEIADSLGLTANTVKGYMKSLYGKLGVSRRVQVAARFKAMGTLKAE